MMMLRGVFDADWKTIVLCDASKHWNNIDLPLRELEKQRVNTHPIASAFCKLVYMPDTRGVIVDSLYMTEPFTIPSDPYLQSNPNTRWNRYFLYTGANVGGHAYWLMRVAYKDSEEFIAMREQIYMMRDHYIGEGREDFMDAFFAMRML